MRRTILRKLSAGCIVCVMAMVGGVALPCPAQAAMEQIPLSSDVPARIVGGHVLVPLRTIAKSLGATVEWDSGSRQATLSLADHIIRLRVGSKAATTVRGSAESTVNLDAGPIIVRGRALVPLRFIGEAFDADVLWRPQTRQVEVTHQGRCFVLTVPGEQTRAAPRPAERTVYIAPYSGRRWHTTPNCWGLSRARSVKPVSLSEARRRGLTPCKICAGG